MMPASWPSSLFVVITPSGWKADGGKGIEGLSLLPRKISSHSFSYSITFVTKVLIIEDIFFFFVVSSCTYFKGACEEVLRQAHLASLTSLYPNQRPVGQPCSQMKHRTCPRPLYVPSSAREMLFITPVILTVTRGLNT